MALLQRVTRSHWIEFGIRGALWCVIMTLAIVAAGQRYDASIVAPLTEVPVGVAALHTVIEFLRLFARVLWPRKVRLVRPNLPLLWAATMLAGTAVGAGLGHVVLAVVS